MAARLLFFLFLSAQRLCSGMAGAQVTKTVRHGCIEPYAGYGNVYCADQKNITGCYSPLAYDSWRSCQSACNEHYDCPPECHEACPIIKQSIDKNTNSGTINETKVNEHIKLEPQQSVNWTVVAVGTAAAVATLNVVVLIVCCMKTRTSSHVGAQGEASQTKGDAINQDIELGITLVDVVQPEENHSGCHQSRPVSMTNMTNYLNDDNLVHRQQYQPPPTTDAVPPTNNSDDEDEEQHTESTAMLAEAST